MCRMVLSVLRFDLPPPLLPLVLLVLSLPFSYVAMHGPAAGAAYQSDLFDALLGWAGTSAGGQ